MQENATNKWVNHCNARCPVFPHYRGDSLSLIPVAGKNSLLFTSLFTNQQV